jgi:hypothetical protein
MLDNSVHGPCDYEDLPEPTEVERDWILLAIDPAWRSRFFNASIAWDYYYRTRAPEMDSLTIEARRETNEIAIRNEVLKDIGSGIDTTPWIPGLARKQVG